MISTSRCRTLLTALAVWALLLVAATPALAAAPSANEPQPPSLLAHVVDWLAYSDFTWTPGSNALAVATSTAAPDMDPDGILAAPPVLDPQTTYASPDGDDDGETAPNMDPDG